MVLGMCKLTIDGKIFDAHPGGLLFFPAGPAIARSARDRKAASITKSSRPPVRDQPPGWIGPSVLRYD